MLVNENQELQNDWSKLTSCFYFFKMKFNVIQNSATHLVCACGNEIIVAKEFKAAWVVCQGSKAGLHDKSKSGKSSFSGALDAYNKACTTLFDEIDEEE